VVSRGVVLDSLAITGDVPEQQHSKIPSARNAKLSHSKGVVLEEPNCSASPGTAVAQGHERQETAQRTSAATPADITGSNVTIAARSSLESAGASRTSSIMVKPGGRFVCGRRKSK